MKTLLNLHIVFCNKNYSSVFNQLQHLPAFAGCTYKVASTLQLDVLFQDHIDLQHTQSTHAASETNLNLFVGL